MAEAHEGLSLQAGDGHRWTLLRRVPAQPRASLLWLPALGVAARHYVPLAEALAERGIAVFLHEARGHGSSSWRASREVDWGYRQLLTLDLPVSAQAMREALPGLPCVIGGHSLGGQLAGCHAALTDTPFDALWLVASGTPYWRTFPLPRGPLLPLAYRFLPWLARRRGALPGHRIGFGGNEARGLIEDWSRVGLGGRYAGQGMDVDIDAAMAACTIPMTGLLFAQDWLAPPASLRALMEKFAHASPRSVAVLDRQALETAPDHFAWMRKPDPVAQRLVASLD
ncbi:alpha/beta hydrolase family protein [Pseudoxanthomonas winnipegensis]|uniref:alpha/beta hydrolase family protein n=1 Tax=Pseudoxanthomonas winnipegensis TaxID=2480810 RepID=UPI003F83D254